VLATIATDQSELAAETRATLAGRSPTSIAIAWRQMREGATLDFDGCMRLEYRVVTRIVRGNDFPEGVRAVILDKDNRPRWSPARIEDIDPAAIDAHVAPLPGAELEFDR
jgi:enoyl-CoA hydratase